MKKLLLILLCLPMIGFGQIINSKIKKIAKKNVEVFLSPNFDENLPFKVSLDEDSQGDLGIEYDESKSRPIINKLSHALIGLGENVVIDGEANTIKVSIRWDILNELKKLNGQIINPKGIIVGSIQYNGPYIPKSHENITKAIAYKLSVTKK